MDRKLIKIIIGILGSLVIVVIVSNNLFISNTPKVNKTFIATIPQKLGNIFSSWISEKSNIPQSSTTNILPSPTPITIVQITPVDFTTLSSSSVSSQKSSIPYVSICPPTPIPTNKTTVVPTAIPTQKTIPTNKPIPTKLPTPTINTQTGSCPTTSSQSYSTIRQNPNHKDRTNFDVSTSAETNIALRGYFKVNESTSLISRNGNKDGLDPNMPPQISTLFQGHYPKIINTYNINNWDYQNNKPIPGESATPAWKVHIIGLEATPGEPLVGLKAGRTIDGKNVFLVIYADKNMIMFIHASEDLWEGPWGPPGYPFYFLDICVDSNLLALYQKNNSEGRNELPGIATGQIFGYAKGNEVKMTIRDTMSFMDPRYKEDWWEYQ